MIVNDKLYFYLVSGCFVKKVVLLNKEVSLIYLEKSNIVFIKREV